MLEVGHQVPDLDVVDQNGAVVNLSKLQGQKLVVYFYPKDDTPGCTAEACNFRDHHSVLEEKGYQVIGVSPDPEAKHQKFIAKYELPFTLISDTEQALCKAFGVWGPKKFMGREYDGVHRTTFIIDEKGVITHVIKKVDTKNSTQQILDLVG